MSAADLLQTLLSLPRDLLWTAGGVFALVILLSLYVWHRISRSRALTSIGLRRIESVLQDSERIEPEAQTNASAAPDPLESPDPLFSAPEEPAGTRVTETRHNPQPAAEPPPRAEPEVKELVSPQPARPAAPHEIHRETPPWTFLQTLPFRSRPGLRTGHADRLGISVEAVFFPADAARKLSDPVQRLVPFLPDGELLFRESDRRTFSMGSLFAQPDAVIEVEGGLLSVEYKSRGGREDDQADFASGLRTKDLLQTLIEAMVLSAETGRAVAPLLRTNNAVYFLRPERRITALLADRIAAAEDFVAPYSARDGIAASDYAALCAVPAEMIFAAGLTNEEGQAAHRSLIG